MYRVKEVFLWFKIGQTIPDKEVEKEWINKGYIVQESIDNDKDKPEETKKEKKLNFDLNNDGKVDKKDRTIAAKVLGSSRRRRKR